MNAVKQLNFDHARDILAQLVRLGNVVAARRPDAGLCASLAVAKAALELWYSTNLHEELFAIVQLAGKALAEELRGCSFFGSVAISTAAETLATQLEAVGAPVPPQITG